MITWIVSSSILIIAVLILRSIVRKKISRRMQYAMWGLVLIRLLMPFSILDSHISIMNIIPENAASEFEDFVLPIQTQEPTETVLVQQKETKQVEIADCNSMTKFSDESNIVTKHKDKMLITDILHFVWLIGGTLLGLWFVSANTVFFIRIRKNRIYYEKTSVKLPVYLSKNVVSPCLFGVIHPSIYLTNKAVKEGVSTEHVIAHELCHYHHGDHIWSFMRGICLTFWWWNPLVWIAAIISKKDAEMACDEAVIQKLGETERLSYGRTLLGMIAVQKKKNILNIATTITTMTSDKQDIKERLNMIIKHPKVVRPVVIGVIVVILIISVSTFTGAFNTKETQAITTNTNNENQISLSEFNQKDASQFEETIAVRTEAIPTETTPTEETSTEETPTELVQSETIELKALYMKDYFEGGRMFLDEEEFVASFQDNVAALTIPDARKGAKATNILEKDDWNEELIYLNSLPEMNIYLYGYNDTEHFGEGLILDIGEQQHIYSFPYPYMTTSCIPPSISASNDGSKLYVSCSTGTGTGMATSELYVFQINNNEVEPYYVDINELTELLINKLDMIYNTTSKNMTIYMEGKQIATDTLIGNEGIPERFYIGDFIYYVMDGDTIRVICKPTIYLQDQVGIPSYLESVSFEADINFNVNSNGKIIGFGIGELVVIP